MVVCAFLISPPSVLSMCANSENCFCDEHQSAHNTLATVILISITVHILYFNRVCVRGESGVSVRQRG